LGRVSVYGFMKKSKDEAMMVPPSGDVKDVELKFGDKPHAHFIPTKLGQEIRVLESPTPFMFFKRDTKKVEDPCLHPMCKIERLHKK